MVFNSLTFLVFFVLVLFLDRLPLSWTARKSNLLVGSYLFYAAWNPPFILLLWISTLVDWFAASWIARTEDAHRRKLYLALSMSANLGWLAFFKYGTLLTTTVIDLLGHAGIQLHVPPPNIILPIGISFYTFHSMSYTIDVYRRRIRPWSSMLDFALYVTFFPQLVAGPILRAGNFLPQCVEPRRATPREFRWGLHLILFGLFSKVVLADALLATPVDRVYNAATTPGFGDAWLSTFAFSGQIFCDFAGYSGCAIGIAMCLGFGIMDNFRYPYAAVGFSDFWRRWHISLSSWLRDYLYIPLGGNRGAEAATYRNLMLTMLLGGLWHGAAWTFVVWGGLHGGYLAIERFRRGAARREAPRRWTLPARALGTYLLVCIAWVFFRATTFHRAFEILTAMFTPWRGAPVNILRASQVPEVLVLTMLLLATHWTLRNSSMEQAFGRLSEPVRVALVGFLIFGLVTMSGNTRAFIYFQF